MDANRLSTCTSSNFFESRSRFVTSATVVAVTGAPMVKPERAITSSLVAI